MSGIPNAIVATLAAEIRSRREWDAPPCLYTLYVEGGRPRLAPIRLPDAVWSGRPADALCRMSRAGAQFTRLFQAAAAPGLYGAAFFCEMWQVSAPRGDDATVQKIVEDGNAHRIWQRPDRVEVRQIWAVDRARVSYMAGQERISGEVTTDVRPPRPGMDYTGAIPDALDRLVSAFLGVTMPERSSDMAAGEGGHA